MDEYENLFYLREDGAERICAWIEDNSYSLDLGHFELCFLFSPYGNFVELTCFQGDNIFHLEVDGDGGHDESLRTVDSVLIDTYPVQLSLSAEALKTYFKLARKDTEAHLEEDCEPPGFGLSFEVFPDRCNILSSRGQLIEVR